MSEDKTPAEETEALTGDAPAGDIEALKAETTALKEQVLRYAADMENTRRRAEREANDARAYAIQKFARDLLVVADNLERALQAAPKDADAGEAGLVTGLELTQKSLLSAFEANNLVRVAPAAGDPFDPHFHQAMMEQPSETVPGGTVIQTLQAGYALFGRTVRPAMVVVAAKGSGAAAGNAAYVAAGATPGGSDTQA